MSATRYPLAWPVGWTRTEYRRTAKFGAKSVAGATMDLLHELRLLGVGADDVVVSTNVELRLDGLPRSNQAAPRDPGAAVYFLRKKMPFVLACDRWHRVEHNLYAIAKHVEAMRGMDRWGVGSLEQAFTGYAALPAHTNGARAWWTVLELDDGAQAPEVVRDVYRELAKTRHPDRGGSHESFVELQRAYEEGMRACGGTP